MSSKFAPEAVRPEVLRGLEQGSADAERRLVKATKQAEAAQTELDRLKKALPQAAAQPLV
ncbi:hypothetical protein B0H14DRAFT_3438226 [Mycena olivaceomarginata]|nr:hypothetical protein B0H14DRAFT_3463830 [Mycena olivaceomarginata]KAJ7861110.1 hypothetical protein B0H14DRAFT_3445633 [Mycena olivaceomarginata]KAJ7873667.1 hypothetical protein B0H14DRAFT_3438226 [Mycena olivaceomarginata]